MVFWNVRPLETQKFLSTRPGFSVLLRINEKSKELLKIYIIHFSRTLRRQYIRIKQNIWRKIKISLNEYFNGIRFGEIFKKKPNKKNTFDI